MVSVTPLIAVIATVAALSATAGIGLWYVRGSVNTAESFVSAHGLASEGMTAASVVASVMGVWILLSPAEAGAAYGGLSAVFGYALGSAVPLALFVPIGTRIRHVIPDGHSLTEYVLARFGRRFYAFVLVVSVFYLFVFLAAEMTGISLAFSLVAGVPPWLTAALVGGFVLVYTTYGGLLVSIVTDTLQTIVLLPLLFVAFAGALFALGGPGELYQQTTAHAPALLNLGNPAGIAFGVYVVFAVLGANMLDQGMWQRVWAAESTTAVRRSFGIAALVVIPLLLLPGLFGIAAAGLGLVNGNPGVAFFLVVNAAFPDWATLGVVVAASLLVASSADTILNAIASIVTTDIARILSDPTDRTLTLVARGLTAVVAVAAIVVGARGYDVLTLFFLADLLGAATFVPFLLGLYLPQLSETAALVGSVCGLAFGLAYFPAFHGVINAVGLGSLTASSFLVSFVGATAVSAAVTLVAAAVAPNDSGFTRLGDAVSSFEGVRER